MTGSSALCSFEHDSLQYHFFAPNFICAARVFHTDSLTHTSAWVYDGKEVREIFLSDARLESRANDHVDVVADGISIFANNKGGKIELAGSSNLKVQFDIKEATAWSDTISDVIHQPHLQATINLDGREIDALGYYKRYSWTPTPNYWGYRFIQGFSNDRRLKLWTAEATFGEEKYDYFNALLDDSRIRKADKFDSCHRQNGAVGILDGKKVQVEIEELGVWRAKLKSDVMDSAMRQRACKLTVHFGDEKLEGLAINETCYGTLA